MVRRLLLGTVVALLPAGAAWAQPAPPVAVEDQIVLAGTVTVPRGSRVGEIVVFSGRAIVDGVATGDVVVLEGPVTVTGQVNGSVIAADGRVALGASARVGGDVSASERVITEPGSEVGGRSRAGVRFSLEGPLAALGELLGPVAIAGSVLLAGIALLLVVPRGADAVADALSGAPLASLGWGVLAWIAVPITAVALIVSVLGVPLGLSVLLSLGLWWLVGLTWAAWVAGRAIVRASERRLPVFLAGWAILSAVGLVPVLNVALWTFAPVLGLGAMVVAAWRSRSEPEPGRHSAREAASSEEDAVRAGAT